MLAIGGAIRPAAVAATLGRNSGFWGHFNIMPTATAVRRGGNTEDNEEFEILTEI